MFPNAALPAVNPPVTGIEGLPFSNPTGAENGAMASGICQAFEQLLAASLDPDQAMPIATGSGAGLPSGNPLPGDVPVQSISGLLINTQLSAVPTGYQVPLAPTALTIPPELTEAVKPLAESANPAAASALANQVAVEPEQANLNGAPEHADPAKAKPQAKPQAVPREARARSGVAWLAGSNRKTAGHPDVRQTARAANSPADPVLGKADATDELSAGPATQAVNTIDQPGPVSVPQPESVQLPAKSEAFDESRRDPALTENPARSIDPPPGTRSAAEKPPARVQGNVAISPELPRFAAVPAAESGQAASVQPVALALAVQPTPLGEAAPVPSDSIDNSVKAARDMPALIGLPEIRNVALGPVSARAIASLKDHGAEKYDRAITPTARPDTSVKTSSPENAAIEVTGRVILSHQLLPLRTAASAVQAAAGPAATDDKQPLLLPQGASESVLPAAADSSHIDPQPLQRRSLAPVTVAAPVQPDEISPVRTRGATETAQPNGELAQLSTTAAHGAAMAPLPLQAADIAIDRTTISTGDNPADAPRDFAALVDTLVRSREAASPRPVHISVPHAEFGPVSVRFEHDGSALSVAMSNPDPDFARAVQAAQPVDRAPALSDGIGAAGQSSRSDAASTGSDAQAQSRSGPSGDRQGSDTRPRQNPASDTRGQPRGDPRSLRGNPRQDGIFA